MIKACAAAKAFQARARQAEVIRSSRLELLLTKSKRDEAKRYGLLLMPGEILCWHDALYASGSRKAELHSGFHATTKSLINKAWFA